MKINQALSYSSLVIGGCVASYGLYQRNFKKENNWIAIITGVGLLILGAWHFATLKGRVKEGSSSQSSKQNQQVEAERGKAFTQFIKTVNINDPEIDPELKNERYKNEELELKKDLFQSIKKIGDSLDVPLEKKEGHKNWKTACEMNLEKAIIEHKELNRESSKVIYQKIIPFKACVDGSILSFEGTRYEKCEDRFLVETMEKGTLLAVLMATEALNAAHF